MFRIGFIDEDEGQRNHFRQTFKDDFEIHLTDLSQDSTADDLIREAFENHLDALIIDYRMDDFLGFNGDTIARKLNDINPYFPVIILTSFEDEALDFVDNANIVNSKDIWSGDSPPEEIETFKKKLKRLINSYNEKIIEAEEKLKILEEKKKVERLQPNEEDEYVALNHFLDKVLGREATISRQFYSQDTNEKLDNLIERTEELLNKLTKK